MFILILKPGLKTIDLIKLERESQTYRHDKVCKSEIYKYLFGSH